MYREHALHTPEVVDQDPNRSLVRFDVSGKPGQRGVDGADGGSGVSSGANGADGRPAGPAGAGQQAGAIELFLEPVGDADTPTMVVSGRVVAADGSEQPVRGSAAFGDGGFLDLVAVGGRGGDGGHGGAGGHGARGSKGHDATRYTSGGNGGDGGDGGDGAPGTSGARGGNGGLVTVGVGADDTHLLMLLRGSVAAGDGGRAGRNGRGGGGGSGGPGGASHSWTTHSTHTDSKGVTHVKTHHHSSPGGSSGRSGRSGRNATAVLVDGPAGSTGHFEIQVHEADGAIRRYADRYRVRLVGFTHVSENHDGIYEPLERVEVTGLRVENVGGMPTPPNHPIELALDSQGWVWPEKKSLVLPPAVRAGETATVQGSLWLKIQDWQPEGPADPLEVVEHIVHTAHLPAAHRAFDRYHATGDPKGRFVVRHPVRVSEVEALPSLAPGEATRVRFRVESIAARAFGAASEIGRRLRFRLCPHDSEVGAEHLRLYDADDRLVPFEQGWVQEIDELGPGSTASFEGTLALDPGAPHYHSAKLWLSLELAPPGETTAPRPIQHRALEVRVARRYRRVEGCELLLVTNQHTTREQLDAWEALAARVGLPMAVWDVSLEGHLDLSRTIGDGTLKDHLASGTVVVLDPPVKTAVGAVQPHRLIDREQLAALVAANIGVAIFGGDAGDVPIERWLVPAEGGTADAHRESAAEFREALSGLAGGGEAAIHETMDVHHVGLWFEPPTQERLGARALALSEHLQAEYPHRRFVVEPHFDPQLVSSWGLARRWKLGTLTVRSTFEAARTAVVHAPGVPTADQLADDGAVEQLVLVARDFEQKLAHLEEALRERREAWAEVRAVLVDLVNEQRAILEPGWRRGLSSDDMTRALPLLRRLVEHAPRLPTPALDGWRAVALVEIAARLRYHAAAQPRWWEWALYPARRAPQLRLATGELVDAWLAAVFAPDDRKAAQERVAARVKALEEERVSREEAMDPRTFARVMLREPIEWKGVTSDAELMTTPQARVVDATKRKAIDAADEEDEWMRARVASGQRDARDELLRPMRVEQGEEEREEIEADDRDDEAERKRS